MGIYKSTIQFSILDFDLTEESIDFRFYYGVYFFIFLKTTFCGNKNIRFT